MDIQQHISLSMGEDLAFLTIAQVITGNLVQESNVNISNPWLITSSRLQRP